MQCKKCMDSGKIHAIEFGKSKVYGRQFNRFSNFFPCSGVNQSYGAHTAGKYT